MKIVLVSYPYLPGLGGVERSVHNLAHFMTARGGRVIVVTHQESGFPFRWERDGAVRVLRLHIPSPFESDARRRLLGKLYDLANGFALGVLGLFFRPQIVHSHLINVDTRYAARLARVFGAGFVTSLRGGETEHWIAGREVRREFVTRMLAEADRVTAVSADLIEQGAQLLPSLKAKAEVIPNPTDVELIRMTRRAGKTPKGGAYVLFAGRLEEMKDVACLVDAFHRIRTRRPDFPLGLVIAGSGSLEDDLRRRAEQGPGGGIDLIGRTSYADTLALIDSAAMLVLPSIFSEGCPNAVLEAMALETPVVVSSLPSLTELVEDGESGLIFPMGDAEALRRRIEEVSDDPALGRRLAAQAKKRIDVQHSPAQILERIEAIYRELTGVSEPS